MDFADAPGHASVHVDPLQLTEQDAVHVTSHFAPLLHVALPDFPRPIVHVAWSHVTLPLSPVASMLHVDPLAQVALHEVVQLPAQVPLGH